MGGSGGGTSSQIQDIPKEFKPAYTALFNSAFGASRTAAGQPGFGTAGQPTGATELSNMISGYDFGLPYSPYFPYGGSQDPYQMFLQQGYVNTPQQFNTQQQGGTPGALGQGSQSGYGSDKLTDAGYKIAQGGVGAGGWDETDMLMSYIKPYQGTGLNQLVDYPLDARNIAPANLEAGSVGLGSKGVPLAAGDPIVGPAFPEQFTAGTSPLEFEALQQKADLARRVEGLGDPLMQLGYDTSQGDYLRAESNPYLLGNIEASLNPILENFQTGVMPNFQSNAIQAGAFSGSSARDMAFNQLASTFGQQLMDTGTQIAFENYQRERELQQGAGALMDQGSLLSQLSPELLAQVGLGQRELAQRPLDEALLQFQEQINAPFRPLFPLASIIQGTDIGSIFSQTVPTPSGLSTGLLGALGGASAGASVGGSLGYGDLGSQIGALLGGLGGGVGGATQ